MRRLGIILFFVGCQSNNLNYRVANELFENFDTILSPEEYAKTIYFYKDNMGEWRDLKDSLVNINIPYKGDYFTFSKSFLNENPENSDGTLSDYISKYEDGIQSISYYKLDKIISLNDLIFDNMDYLGGCIMKYTQFPDYKKTINRFIVVTVFKKGWW